jgi:hypothetical protein
MSQSVPRPIFFGKLRTAANRLGMIHCIRIGHRTQDSRPRAPLAIHDRFSTNLPLSSGVQPRIGALSIILVRNLALYTGRWLIVGVRIRPRIIPNGVLLSGLSFSLREGGLSRVIHDRFFTDLPICNAIQPRIRALSTILVRSLAVNTGRRITSGVRIRHRTIANGVLVVWALVLTAAERLIMVIHGRFVTNLPIYNVI